MDEKDIQILKLTAELSNHKKEVAMLRETVSTLQNQLEKYTNNERHKRYYEKNKEKVKQNAKQYLDNLKVQNPEKLKEYRHRAYLKRKERNVMEFHIGLN
jgi:hypothetical protein